MKIAITGGAGFIGSNAANYLSKKHKVKAIDNLKFGNRANVDPGVNFGICNFEDITTEELNTYDVLVHMATANIIYAQKNQVDTFKVNALETINLFERFKGKIIYTSTASVYGQAEELPTPEHAQKRVSNAYDQSKLIGEKYLELRGDFTTLRLSNVYGPGQRADNPYCGVMGKFIDAGLRDEPMLIFGSGLDTRDYTFIDDVIDAVDRAIELPSTNCAINISGQNEVSVDELAVYISMVLEQPLNAEYVKCRSIDTINRRFLDIRLAKSLLGWSPKTNLKTGLEKTINWNRCILH